MHGKLTEAELAVAELAVTELAVAELAVADPYSLVSLVSLVSHYPSLSRL